MNVLIIGFGTAGRYYLKILKSFKKIKKIFIVDDLKLPKSKKYIQIQFNSKELKKNSIKYAIISTPSGSHYDYALKLVNNSINTLIEKPFVLNLYEAKNLIKKSKSKKIKCWVVFQNRYNLAIRKLVQVVNKKILGKIFLIDCSLIWKRDKKYYSSPWRGKYRSDGGVLSNQAIHLLDAVIYVFGKVKKFSSILSYNKKKLEAEDLALLNLVHDNNTLTSFKATTRADSNYRSAMDVIGEKGRVLVKGISLNTFHYLKGNDIKNDKKNSEEFGIGAGTIGAMGNGHLKILKEFFSKKIKNSSQKLEIRNNMHVLSLLHSIYNSEKLKILNKVSEKESVLGKK